MDKNLVRSGDRVVVRISRRNRMSGHVSCPNGIEANVIGFGIKWYGRFNEQNVRPGMYHDRSEVVIMGSNGVRYTMDIADLALVDEFECARRDMVTHDRIKCGEDIRQDDFISDLPHTPFREKDWVEIWPGHRTNLIVGACYRIKEIDYAKVCANVDGSMCRRLYALAVSRGVIVWAAESDISLIKQGPAWSDVDDVCEGDLGEGC